MSSNKHCLLLVLMVATIFHAENVAAEYKASLESESSTCQIWAPSMLDSDEYPVRYTGNCVNGRAEGKGQAQWLYRYGDSKVKATWNGLFRNGVFIGDWKISGKVQPINSNAYLVGMGKIKGATLTFVASSAADGPLDMCRPQKLILETDSSVEITDDVQVKTTMEEALRVYEDLCKNRDKNPFRISVFNEPFKLTSAGYIPASPVEAHYAGGLGASRFSYYSNSAKINADQQARVQKVANARKVLQKRFDDYSRQHKVNAWVTTKQLDENPFRWEGQTVGLVVQLDKMLSRNAALVTGPKDNWQESGVLQILGVTPDFPDSNTLVLLIASVTGRQDTGAAGSSGKQYTTLQYRDMQRCTYKNCDEWLGWQTTGNQLEWNSPYQSKQP